MKNIAVSLDDETYRRSRMIAAQRDTSVSGLVRQFLIELTSGETERPKRDEHHNFFSRRIGCPERISIGVAPELVITVFRVGV
jgi:hypothetical protein